MFVRFDLRGRNGFPTNLRQENQQAAFPPARPIARQECRLLWFFVHRRAAFSTSLSPARFPPRWRRSERQADGRHWHKSPVSEMIHAPSECSLILRAQGAHWPVRHADRSAKDLPAAAWAINSSALWGSGGGISFQRHSAAPSLCRSGSIRCLRPWQNSR